MKAVVSAWALFVATPLFASPVFLGEPSNHLELEPIEESFGAELIGGEAASPEDYPGVFYTRQGNSRCTGTVVGPKVVATAAHCVSNGGTLSLTYKGDTYSGRCTHASQYRRNSTADWALCLLTEAIPDAIAETINTEASRLNRGDELVLMGYGCTRNGGGGGNDGVLRVGSAPIRSLPSGSNYDIVTTGRSALCYGDSGGPSFFVDAETGLRYQTGINSRGNISTTSYLSSLHVDVVLDFYREWSDRNSVKICGLHEDAEGCLQSAIDLPTECDGVRDQITTLGACTTAATPPDSAVCSDAITAVQACVEARNGF